MRTYWSSEVANVLGISPNTLRKWSLALENAGYKFLRDDKNNRAYKDSDIITFRRLQEFLNNKMTMDHAVLAVMSTYDAEESTSRTDTVLQFDRENALSVRSDERYRELETKFDEYVKQQQAFNQELIQQLQKMDERLRHRDERLTEAMNTILETKRLLAAAQEQPRKKWYEFWK